MWKWILSKIFRRKYFISVDGINMKDFTAISEGYIDKNGIIQITKVSVFDNDGSSVKK
jgi:hypothetical protein